MNELMLYNAPRGNMAEVIVQTYPDGMPLIDWQQLGAFASDEQLSLLLRPQSITTFLGAMFLVDSLVSRQPRTVDLVLPLVPGCRQDRANQYGDYLVTLHSFATIINAREFRSVTVLDPHSDVTPGLIHNCRVVQAADMIGPPVGKYAAVVSPDAGAEKRAQKVARKLGLPLLHAWKTRDIGTGNITGFGMEPHGLPKDSLVLVVDDLCDAGGTFLGLADILDANKLRAHMWVTHGLFTKGTEALLKRYGHVYCSDSASGPRDGVIEIAVCEKLLRGEKI